MISKRSLAGSTAVLEMVENFLEYVSSNFHYDVELILGTYSQMSKTGNLFQGYTLSADPEGSLDDDSIKMVAFGHSDFSSMINVYVGTAADFKFHNQPSEKAHVYVCEKSWAPVVILAHFGILLPMVVVLPE